MGRALVRSYYRVEVVGKRYDDDGPLIVVANHSNGLIDGAMVLEGTARPLLILVKSGLLRLPLLGRLLRSIGAVPLYRRRDGADTTLNETAFTAVEQALARGQPILVFPEGTSTATPELGPLKTGAARMALGAEQRAGFRLGLRILPLGIVYEGPQRFRSRATTVVGEPFGLERWHALLERDEREAVLALTESIEAALRELAVIGSTEGEVQERIDADTLAPPDGRARPERWRAAARAQAAPFSELGTADSSLAELRAAAAAQGLPLSEANRLAASDPGFAAWLAEAPLVFAGALLWAPPILGARLVTRLAPLPIDKRVSATLLACWMLIPLWLVLLGLFAGWRGGALAGFACALLAVVLGRFAVLGWPAFRAPSFRVAERLRAPRDRALRQATRLLADG